MLCPRCGTRQPLGSVRCSNCGAPFTRREAAKRPASSRATVVPSPPQSYRRYERSSGVRRSVIAWLSVLTIVVIAVVALAAFFSSSVVKPYVDKKVNTNVQAAVSTAVSSAPTTAAATDSQQTSGSEQLVITQQEINDQIAQNASSFGPVSGVQVQIDSGQFIVNFKAYGMSGRYTGEVAMRDGQPVLTNGHVSGTLGMFVSTSTVENALNRQIAAQVSKRGVQVSSVALQPGKMVLTLSS